MSVSITGSEGSVALYDSTTGIAFGPVFEDSDRADNFLEWFREGYEAERTFPYGHDVIRFVEDVRLYRPDELNEIYQLWLAETESD